MEVGEWGRYGREKGGREDRILWVHIQRPGDLMIVYNDKKVD